MKKGLLKTLFLTFVALILLGTKKAQAGHDLGTLSKDNPCIYIKFTLQKGEEFFGGFFNVSGNATDVKLSFVNLSKGDVSLKAIFSDISDEWTELKKVTFKKGKKKSTFSLPDLEDEKQFFIEINNPKFYDQEEMTIGLCIYSEGFGGTKHDFTKMSLSKDEITLKEGKSAKLKVTLDKSLKKDGVIWSTSNKKVATVDKKGKITAKGAGDAIITCTSKKNKNISEKCTVWVTKDIVQSGNIEDVTLTEEPYQMDTAYRYLTLETNGYSGELVLEFKCDDGTDIRTITVDKNKTYYIEYKYSFIDRDNNWQDYIRGGLSLYTKVVSVEIQGGAYSAYSKLTGNTFNMGEFTIHE